MSLRPVGVEPGLLYVIVVAIDARLNVSWFLIGSSATV